MNKKPKHKNQLRHRKHNKLKNQKLLITIKNLKITVRITAKIHKNKVKKKYKKTKLNQLNKKNQNKRSNKIQNKQII